MHRLIAERLCTEIVAQLKLRHPERVITAGPKPTGDPMTNYGFVIQYVHNIDFHAVANTMLINASYTLDSIGLALSKHVWFHIYPQPGELAACLVVSPVHVAN